MEEESVEVRRQIENRFALPSSCREVPIDQHNRDSRREEWSHASMDGRWYRDEPW